MIVLNIQLFGGRGSGSGGNGGDLLGKGGGDPNPRNIRDMISDRGTSAQTRQATDEVLSVARRMNGLFGNSGVITQFQTATMTGALGYYDSSGNIAISRGHMNSAAMDRTYDAGGDFHPGRGNKSGLQAVASHEYGHALTDAAGRKLGINDIEKAARTIVERARKKTGQRKNINFAKQISGYAQYNFAECVAEAVCDWHCNGSRAKRESRAVMAVLSSILRH